MTRAPESSVARVVAGSSASAPTCHLLPSNSRGVLREQERHSP